MKIKYSKTTIGPDVEPIDISTAMSDLKLDADNTESNLLLIWIQAARELVETRTGRSLITQTRVIKFDTFPCYDSIYLTHGPVQSVTSVKYIDEAGNEQTLNASSYWLDLDSDVPRIVVKESWPQIRLNQPNAVIITYVCGYGDEPDNVPAALRSAILLYLAHLYKNREEGAEREKTTGIIDEVPFGAEMLMRPFVVEQDVIQ